MISLLEELIHAGLESLDILRKRVHAAQHTSLLLLRAVLDLLLQLRDLSLNDGATAASGVRSEPQDVALLLINLVDVKQPDVILHDAAKLLEGRLLHDGCDAREGGLHDCNQHVHEDQLNDQCSNDEHHPNHCRVLVRVILVVEIAETGEVSVDHGINWGDTNQRFVEGITRSPVQVQDEDDVCEGGERDEEHDKEDLNVLDDLSDHANEGTEGLEESHPVEELEVHQEGRNGSNDLQLVVVHVVSDLIQDVDHVEAKRGEVNDVPGIEEVLEASLPHLNKLQNQECHKGFAEDAKAADLSDEAEAKVLVLEV